MDTDGGGGGKGGSCRGMRAMHTPRYVDLALTRKKGFSCLLFACGFGGIFALIFFGIDHQTPIESNTKF